MSASGLSSSRKVISNPRCEGTMRGSPPVATCLPPSHLEVGAFWTKIVILIMDSDFIKDLTSKFIRDDCERGEWRSLSIDGTTKVANVQKAQATATTCRAKSMTKRWPISMLNTVRLRYSACQAECATSGCVTPKGPTASRPSSLKHSPKSSGIN